MTEPYHVRLAVFDGPLDLLLHLIEKQELDITLVSLAQVTDQFIAYLGNGSDIPSEMLADFLVVAAKLIYLKSVALLPVPPKRSGDDEEANGDDLVRQLLDYRQAKRTAELLKELDEAGLRSYIRIAPPPERLAPITLEGLDLAGLIAAAQAALEVLPTLPPVASVVSPIPVSLPDRIAHVRRALATYGRVTFRELLQHVRSRVDVIVTLLAVLEMIKRQLIDVQQDALFGEITISSISHSAAPAPTESDEATPTDPDATPYSES